MEFDVVEYEDVIKEFISRLRKLKTNFMNINIQCPRCRCAVATNADIAYCSECGWEAKWFKGFCDECESMKDKVARFGEAQICLECLGGKK